MHAASGLSSWSMEFLAFANRSFHLIMSIVSLHSSLLASVATRGTKRLVDITTLCSIVKVLGVVLSDDIKTAALLYECVIFFIIFKCKVWKPLLLKLLLLLLLLVPQ